MALIIDSVGMVIDEWAELERSLRYRVIKDPVVNRELAKLRESITQAVQSGQFTSQTYKDQEPPAPKPETFGEWS